MRFLDQPQIQLFKNSFFLWHSLICKEIVGNRWQEIYLTQNTFDLYIIWIENLATTLKHIC